jgi:hypothetical protein
MPEETGKDWQRTLANQIYGGASGAGNIFAALKAPVLAETNPLFRQAAGRTMDRVFSARQDATPTESFLDWIIKRRGFFGGQ